MYKELRKMFLKGIKELVNPDVVTHACKPTKKKKKKELFTTLVNTKFQCFKSCDYDQPIQNPDKMKHSQAGWYMPIIPATQETGQHSKNLSPKRIRERQRQRKKGKQAGPIKHNTKQLDIETDIFSIIW